MTTETAPNRGLLISWAALMSGLSISMAANIAHADSHILAKILSGFLPVSLAIALEVTARVPWGRHGALGGIVRAVVLLVGLVAAAGSYSHLYSLLLGYGENHFVSSIYALAVDGLAVVGALGILATGTRTDKPVRRIPEQPAVVPAVPATPVPPIEPVPVAVPEPGTKTEETGTGTVAPLGTAKRPVPHEVLVLELFDRYAERGDSLTAAKLIDEMKIQTGTGVSKGRACELVRTARQVRSA